MLLKSIEAVWNCNKRAIIVLTKLYPRYCVNYTSLLNAGDLLKLSVFKGLASISKSSELHLLICSPAHAAQFRGPEKAFF